MYVSHVWVDWIKVRIHDSRTANKREKDIKSARERLREG